MGRVVFSVRRWVCCLPCWRRSNTKKAAETFWAHGSGIPGGDAPKYVIGLLQALAMGCKLAAMDLASSGPPWYDP